MGKPRAVIFHEKTVEIIRGFSKAVRTDVGELLFDLQCGENIGMPEARSMPYHRNRRL
jgi:hypothetical protein